MKIAKDSRIYSVVENLNQWNIKSTTLKVNVSYNVPKDICETFEDLEKYVLENDLF